MPIGVTPLSKSEETINGKSGLQDDQRKYFGNGNIAMLSDGPTGVPNKGPHRAACHHPKKRVPWLIS